MKKIFSLLCLVLFALTSLSSQTITITDAQSGKPLEQVTLHSLNSDTFTTTDTQGQASISSFSPDNDIEIRLVAYKTRVISYTNLQSKNFNVQLSPSRVSLDELIVSATRWNQNSTKVPSKVTAISSEIQKLLSPPTSADLLGLSAQVFVQKSQQGGGSPMIRGFAANRLLYTVDGVRMNTAIYRSGNIQNVISLDPFAIERTEVFFGPGSVIYGSDAIGGVMSFQTLKPKFSLNDKVLTIGTISTRYATANDEKTAHIDLNVGWKKWALVTSFSIWDYGDLRQGSNGPEDYLKPFHVAREEDKDIVIKQHDPLLQKPTAYSQKNFMQKVKYKPNEDWDLEYAFHYSETSPYGRYDRHNRMSSGLPKYAEWNYGPQKWLMNNLSIAHTSRRKLYDHLSVHLAQQSFEESRISRSFNSDKRSIKTENVSAYSLNIDFKKQLLRKVTTFYGAEYILNDVLSKGKTIDLPTEQQFTGPSRYPKAKWSSIGLYINQHYDISKKYTIQAGVRYNHYLIKADFSNNAAFYDFPFSTININNGDITGNLGSIYRPNETWLIRANIGTGFRSPNIDDMGKVFDSEAGAVTLPNPNLKSEYAYNFEIGSAKTFSDIIKIECSAYTTLLNNAMVRRNFQINGQDSIIYEGQMSQVQAIQNATKTHIYGTHLGIEAKLTAGFSFISDLNYQVGREQSENGTISASRHAAPLYGTTRLNYKHKNLTLQLYTSYQGERKFEELALEEQGKDEIYAKDNKGNNYSPAWYTLNVRGMYEFHKSLLVNLGLENITDQRYRPYSSGISAPGRNFIISVSYKL